jgi:uncharacterized membrane protein
MHTSVMAVHIVAGALGLITGFVALYAAKGAGLHRSSGKLFVYSMVTMAMLGAAIAAVWGPAASTNVPAGLLTMYLVITALTTVAAIDRDLRWLHVGLLLVALGVGLSMLSIGVGAIAKGGKGSWMAFPAFMFTTIAFVGCVGDLRVLRSGPRTGPSRLRRHLWRMSTALAIASLSFSVRLPRLLPAPLRHPVVYALPTLMVLGTMFYWLWRVRSKRRSRSIVVARQRGSLATGTV